MSNEPGSVGPCGVTRDASGGCCGECAAWEAAAEADDTIETLRASLNASEARAERLESERERIRFAVGCLPRFASYTRRAGTELAEDAGGRWFDADDVLSAIDAALAAGEA